MSILTKKTEKSLAQLARLLGFDVKRGWRTRLAEHFGVELGVISTWITRDKISKYGINKAKKLGHPPETWLIKEDEEDYVCVKEPSRVYPVPSRRALHKSIDEILASADRETILALESNIKVFLEKVRDKKSCEEEIAALRKEIIQLKNQMDALVKGGLPVKKILSKDKGISYT